MFYYVLEIRTVRRVARNFIFHREIVCVNKCTQGDYQTEAKKNIWTQSQICMSGQKEGFGASDI